MAELLVDLIIEILERSPVKTLLRFRCISKSIRAIIDSRDFIKSHLKTVSDDKTRKKLNDDNDISKLLVFGSQQIFYITDGFRTVSRDLDSYEFLAHCDGLVLLAEGLYSFGVWNPSTRKYNQFPILPDSEGIEYPITGMGFGYDSSTDDYKVLVIKEVKFIERTYEHQLWIWILGLRSCNWRKIAALPYDEYSVIQSSKGCINCFVDGAFHFLCKGDIILKFDVAKEKFSRVPLPKFGQTEAQLFDLQLVVFEGCLCIRLFGRSVRKILELYVRKKDGVDHEFSWTKLFSNIRFVGEHLRYFKERDKIFMVVDRHNMLYSYNYDFNAMHRIEECLHRIDIEDYRYRHSNMIFCIESLVSVDYNEEKGQERRKSRKRSRSYLHMEENIS